jgi:holo-[acyl-carrier protein] synthase
MPTLRLGCDLCRITVIKEMLQDPVALDRLFDTGELAYAGARVRPEEHLAGVFAAKEALAKALRAPELLGKYYRDVAVGHRDDGAAYLLPSEALASSLTRLGARIIDVTISHDGDYAVAAVLVEMTDDARNPRRCRKCLLTLDYLTAQKIADILIRGEDRDWMPQFLCPVCLRGW